MEAEVQDPAAAADPVGGLAEQVKYDRPCAGLLLIILGWTLGHSLIFPAIGAVVLFSAFYDRCPIFRAVAPRLMALFKKPPKPTPEEKPSA